MQKDSEDREPAGWPSGRPLSLHPCLLLCSRGWDSWFSFLAPLALTSNTLTHITSNCMFRSSCLGRACWLHGCHHQVFRLGKQTGNHPSQSSVLPDLLSLAGPLHWGFLRAQTLVWRPSPVSVSSPSEVEMKVKVAQLCSTLWDPMASPWDSPGQNAGVGSLSLTAEDLPNPGIEPGSPAPQAASLPTELSGKPSPRKRI